MCGTLPSVFSLFESSQVAEFYSTDPTKFFNHRHNACQFRHLQARVNAWGILHV